MSLLELRLKEVVGEMARLMERAEETFQKYKAHLERRQDYRYNPYSGPIADTRDSIQRLRGRVRRVAAQTEGFLEHYPGSGELPFCTSLNGAPRKVQYNRRVKLLWNDLNSFIITLTASTKMDRNPPLSPMFWTSDSDEEEADPDPTPRRR